LACSCFVAGLVQASVPTSDAGASVAISLNDSAAPHTLQSKYRFDRSLRATSQDTGTVLISATPLALSDEPVATATTVPVATFTIGDGSLLDGGSISEWPSGRYTESTSSSIGTSGSVMGNVSEVPLPASALLAMIGLGVVGVGRARFTHRG